MMETEGTQRSQISVLLWKPKMGLWTHAPIVPSAYTVVHVLHHDLSRVVQFSWIGCPRQSTGIGACLSTTCYPTILGTIRAMISSVERHCIAARSGLIESCRVISIFLHSQLWLSGYPPESLAGLLEAACLNRNVSLRCILEL